MHIINKILTTLFIALFLTTVGYGQRLKPGKQIAKAPTAGYILISDANGELYYSLLDGEVQSIQNVDLIYNNDGTITWTDNDGAFTFREGWTEVNYNNDGTWTYTYPDGTTNVLDICVAMVDGDCFRLIDNFNGSFTLEYKDGTQIGSWSETLTSLTYNAATNSLSYVDELGNTTTMILGDIAVTNLLSGHLIATVTDINGNTFDIDETITTLVDNGNNTYTYFNENGDAITFDVTGVVTSISYDATAHDITYVDENGNSTVLDLDVGIISYNAASHEINYVDEEGTLTNLDLNIVGVTNLINGNRIATITDEEGNSFDIDETITTLVDNGNGSFTYTREDGATTTWNETTTSIALDVDNQSFNYIDEDGVQTNINLCNVVDNCETVTTLTFNPATYTLGYTDENNNLVEFVIFDCTYLNDCSIGNLGDVDITNVMEGQALCWSVANSRFEPCDQLQFGEFKNSFDGAGGQFPCTEVANNGDWFNVTADVTIDGLAMEVGDILVSLVDNPSCTSASDWTLIQHPDAVISNVTNVINGNRIATHDDGTGNTVDIDETITTLVDNGNESYTYTSETGVQTTFSTAETLTSINYNAVSHEINYTDENGVVTNLDLNVGAISYNAVTHDVVYVDESGVTTTLPLNLIGVTNLINGNRIATITDEEGNAFEIDETITSINVQLVGNILQVTYTDEAGANNQTNIDLSAYVDTNTTYDLNDNSDGTITLVGSDGTNDLIDICAIIAANCPETVTTISYNALTHEVSYVDENGLTTTLDLNVSTVTNVINGNRIATHTSADGTAVDIDETVTTLVDNGNNTFTYTSEDGTQTTITSGFTSVVPNGDGTWTYTYPDATQVTLDVCALMVEGNCIQLVDNLDGSFTLQYGDGTLIGSWSETLTSISYNGATHDISYIDENGLTTVLDLNVSALTNVINGNRIGTHTSADGTVVDIDETITTLVNNGNDTYTYTSEDGTATIIDASETPETVTSISLNVNNTSFDYVDENGTTNNIDLCNIVDNCETLTTLTYNITTNDLTYTDEDGNASVISLADGSISAVTNTIVGNRIATHNDGNGNSVDINETITTLVNNGDGTFTYTSENGTTTTYDETTTSIALNANNTSIDYVDEDGVTTNLDLCTIVTNCETLSSITYNNTTHEITYVNEDGVSNVLDLNIIGVTNLINGNRIATVTDEVGASFDIDETITVLNANIVGQTLTITYTNETGVTNTITLAIPSSITYDLEDLNNGSIRLVGSDASIDVIDICQIVQDNCPETVTSISLLGNTITYTDEDGVATNLVLPVSTVTNVINGNRIATHTSADGTVVEIDETITTLVDNGNDSFTYTSEDGTVTTITESLTSVSLNVNNTSFDYVDEAGLTTNLDLCTIVSNCETLTSLTYNITNNTLTYTDEDGNTNNIVLGSGNTSVVTNVINGNRIATHSDGDGNVVDIDETITTLVVNANGSITYTSEDGTVTNYDETTTSISLNANNTSIDYIDEDGVTTNLDLCTIVSNCETVTSLTYNGATNTLTYTNEDGTSNDIVLGTGTTSAVTNVINGNRIATHDDGNGNLVDIDETVTTLVNNGDGTFTYTSENGTVTNYDETTTTIALNANNTSIDYVDEDGVTTNLDLCAIVTNCETVTSLTYNAATNTLTYTNEDGTSNDIVLGTGTTSAVTNVINGNRIGTHDDGNGNLVDIDETITFIVNNGDGTYTYTAENGGTTVISDVLTTISLNANNTSIDYVDENGATTNLDLCTIVQNCETLTSLTFNAATNTLTYTDEDGNSNDIVLGSGTTSVVTNVINGNRIATHDDGNGNIIDIDETITTIEVFQDTIIRYTNEEGTVTDIDVCNLCPCNTAQAVADNGICTTALTPTLIDLNANDATCTDGSTPMVVVNSITNNNTIVTVGAHGSPAIVWVVDSSLPSSATISYTLECDNDCGTSTAVNATFTCSAVTNQTSDMSIVKTVDNATPFEGDNIVYTLVVTNNGPQLNQNVIINDILPSGVTYVSDDQGNAFADGTENIGDLANGATYAVNITVSVDIGQANNTINNAASVVGDNSDDDLTNNSSDVDIVVNSLESDLAITKAVDDAAPIEGSNVVYTLVVTNNGPDDDTNVTITDNLPMGVTYVSDDQGNVFGDGTENIGALANGATYTVNITVSVDAGTSGTTITNTAAVAGDNDDNVAANDNDDVDIIPFVVCPDVILTELLCEPNAATSGGSKQCGSFECFWRNTLTGDYYDINADVSDCNNLPAAFDLSNYFTIEVETGGCDDDTECAISISSDDAFGNQLGGSPARFIIYDINSGIILQDNNASSALATMQDYVTATGSGTATLTPPAITGTLLANYTLQYDCSSGEQLMLAQVDVFAGISPAGGDVYNIGARHVANTEDIYPYPNNNLIFNVNNDDMIRLAGPYNWCASEDVANGVWCSDVPADPTATVIVNAGTTATITAQGTNGDFTVEGNTGDTYSVTVSINECPGQGVTITGTIQ